MKMKRLFGANAILILLLLAACSALRPTPAPTQAAEGLPVTTGMQYHFVTNKLLMPTTKAQTQASSLNVDGDLQQHPDNVFGQLLTLLTSAAPGLDLQSTVDQAVSTGRVVSLHMVKADDTLNDPSVSWSIFGGQKTQSAPRFDGSDKFTLIPLCLPTRRLLALLRTVTSPAARARHGSSCFY